MMFDVFKIDSVNNRKKYTSVLSLLNIGNPYCQLDYIDVFCDGLKNLMCFSYYNSINDNRIIMLGYKNPVTIGGKTTKFFDFITPYGYTGPVFSANILDSDIIDFWKNVDKWYLDNNVVTEFIRFNLSNNHLNYSGKIFPTMLNIKGRIIDKENQWMSFDRKVRKNVNKAVKEALTSKIYYINIEDKKISEFFNIYIETMHRTNASDKFYYSFDEFKRFISNNKQNCAICTIYFEQTPISSELILISDDSIYSFLGGTNKEYFNKRPNDFLKVEIIDWARDLNKKYYVLGGGYGAEDGIFKYKKSFFKNDVVNYYTGRKVVDKDKYTELIKKLNHIRLNSALPELDNKDTSFFPLYRKLN